MLFAATVAGAVLAGAAAAQPPSSSRSPYDSHERMLSLLQLVAANTSDIPYIGDGAATRLRAQQSAQPAPAPAPER